MHLRLVWEPSYIFTFMCFVWIQRVHRFGCWRNFTNENSVMCEFLLEATSAFFERLMCVVIRDTILDLKIAVRLLWKESGESQPRTGRLTLGVLRGPLPPTGCPTTS